jgi:hypothetical protein
MRRLSASLVSICALLVVTRPSTATLPLGQEAQGLETAGARTVVFEEIAVDVDFVEQELGDRLVAALGDPRPREVAAAEMHADGHAGRAGCDRVVQELGAHSRQRAARIEEGAKKLARLAPCKWCAADAGPRFRFGMKDNRGPGSAVHRAVIPA